MEKDFLTGVGEDRYTYGDIYQTILEMSDYQERSSFAIIDGEIYNPKIDTYTTSENLSSMKKILIY